MSSDWLTTLDPASVGTAFGLAGLAVTSVIGLLSRVGDWTRSLSWWVGAAFCLTAGFTLNSLQAYVSPTWAVAISNPLTVAGGCLFYVGMRHVVGAPIALLRVTPIVLVSVLGSVLFVFVWPSLPGRVFVQLACLAVITALNVGVLRLLDHGYYHFPARFLLIVNVLLVILLIARGVTVMTWGAPPATAVVSNPINALVYSIAGLLILAYLAGILLICFAEKQTLLRRLASEDALTGVLNRLGLRDALNEWPANQSGAVTVFDIDHFKRVNDGFGHETGDILLKTFAQALRACAPANATIARLGGDEFCVVEPLANQPFSTEWIETLKHQLPTRLEIASPSAVSCKVSHGSSRFASVIGEFAEALREADRALYRSKAGRPPQDNKPRAT
jgi:diguanylate cyclase (GGDEF)-like protein